MQNEQPLLTIAIPTYNRSKYLAELLDTLTPQLLGEQRVELIISDNASTDDTHSRLKLFQDRGLIARYIHNKTNIGADSNFLQCFNEARGKYFWLIGDDDIVEEDGISKILDLLGNDEFDIVYVSSYPFQVSHPRHYKATNKKRPPQVFTDANRFVSKVHVFFTFISGNIVNKQRLSYLPHKPFEELVGTNLIQLGWTYTALRYHRKSLYIHEQLIGGRTANTGGYGIFKVFGLNFAHINDHWLGSTKLADILTNKTLRCFFPQYVLLTKSGIDNFVAENPHILLCPAFGSNYRYWLFNYSIIILPKPIDQLWFFFIRLINKFGKLLSDFFQN